MVRPQPFFSTVRGRLALTALCLALMAASFHLIPKYGMWYFTEDDTVVTGHIEKQLGRAAAGFVIAKSLNGAISLLQSLEVGFDLFASLTISPLEILDPANDVIESISQGFLLAMGALTLQRILVGVNAWAALKILIPVGLCLLLFSIWMRDPLRARLRSSGIKTLAVSLAIGAVIPLSIQLSLVLEQTILNNTVEGSVQSLQQDALTVDSIGGELRALEGRSAGKPLPELEQDGDVGAEQDPGWWDSTKSHVSGAIRGIGRTFSDIGETLSLSRLKRKVTGMATTLQEKADSMTRNFLNLLVVFVVNTILLPIATLWVLWQLLRWLLDLPFDPGSLPSLPGRKDPRTT